MDLSCCEQVLFHFINTYPHRDAMRSRPLSETSLTLIPLSSLKSQGQAVQLAHSYEPVNLIFFTTSTPSFVAYFVVCLRHTFAAQSTLQQNRLQRQPLNPLVCIS